MRQSKNSHNLHLPPPSHPLSVLILVPIHEGVGDLHLTRQTNQCRCKFPKLCYYARVVCSALWFAVQKQMHTSLTQADGWPHPHSREASASALLCGAIRNADA